MTQARQEFTGRTAAEAAIKACEALNLTRSELGYDIVADVGELLDRKVTIAVRGQQAHSTRPAPSPKMTRETNPAPQQVSQALEGPAPQRTTVHAETPQVRTSPDDTVMDDEDELPPLRSAVDHHAGPGYARPQRRNSGAPSSPRSRHGRSQERVPKGHEAPRRSERNAQRDHQNGGHPSPRRGRERRPEGGRADHEGIEALLQLDAIGAPEKRAAIAATTPRAERALATLRALLGLMGLDLDAQLVAETDNEMHVDMHGVDSERAIGKKGEVLLALQFALNRMLTRGQEENEQLVVLDAGGYRERRRMALEELAKKLASRAVQERKAVRLTPMSAHDRRVFHMALKELTEVTTRSEGDGLYRNLLIIPAEFI